MHSLCEDYYVRFTVLRTYSHRMPPYLLTAVEGGFILQGRAVIDDYGYLAIIRMKGECA